MKLIVHCITLTLVIFPTVFTFSQNSYNDVKAAQQMVNAEQKRFRDFLTTASLNPTVKKDLQKFAVNDVNSIQTNLEFLVTAPKEKRIKGIRSLSYFMKELKQELQEKKIDEFIAPSVTKKYKQTLNDLLNRKGNDGIERNFSSSNWRICQLLANSFWEFEEKKQISDISAYKRVVETPEYIFSFLERTPGFSYTDSLIMFLTENYPEQLVSYLQKNNNAVTNDIRNKKNIYVQQLVALSSNSLASELAPFAKQIADSGLLINDILDKRKKVNDYFQLLVNTIMANNQQEKRNEQSFQTALENALAKKSLDFYVKKINDMHNSPDAVRFQSVQTLRPQDLYYIIVSADEEMYTSTYLGLYKRLLGKFKDQSADSILNLVNNVKFRKFMRIAATYNTLNDFFHHTTPGRSKTLVHLFISDIENDNEDEAVSNASDIADAFITLSKDSILNSYISEELEAALTVSRQSNQYQSARLHSVLLKVYDIVNNDPPGNLSANYKTLPYSELANNGIVSELVLFYGDEDGKNSFTSFMNLFKDRSRWQVTTTDSWVAIRSLQGQPLNIYANLPLSDDDEKDVAAQEALADYLKSQSVSPSILIHRGHSYHLPNTLNYLDPSVKLAILGSCGGYKNMKKIMELNSQVHIIASKQVGSMVVNDPLLNHLNNDLSAGKDIDWVSFWDELKERFRNDTNTSKLFEEYMPPYKNVSSYVIRLYSEDDPVATQ